MNEILIVRNMREFLFGKEQIIHPVDLWTQRQKEKRERAKRLLRQLRERKKRFSA